VRLEDVVPVVEGRAQLYHGGMEIDHALGHLVTRAVSIILPRARRPPRTSWLPSGIFRAREGSSGDQVT